MTSANTIIVPLHRSLEKEGLVARLNLLPLEGPSSRKRQILKSVLGRTRCTVSKTAILPRAIQPPKKNRSDQNTHSKAAKMAELTAAQKKEFERANKLSFEDQAAYFLNAFWDEWGEKNTQTMWKWWTEFCEVDMEAWLGAGKKKQEYKQSESLQLQFALKFLEKQNQALSPIQYKKAFKAIDANFDGAMSLLEFALHETKKSIADLVSKPQATTPEYEECKVALEKAKQELADYEKKKDEVRIKAQTGTGMAALKAKQEWEKISQEDNLPLERAVVKAESNLKKAQKKVKPPMGSTWWTARRQEEKDKRGPLIHFILN
eukprot:g33246.t1